MIVGLLLATSVRNCPLNLFKRYRNQLYIDPHARSRSAEDVHSEFFGLPVSEFCERWEDLRIRNPHRFGHSLHSESRS